MRRLVMPVVLAVLGASALVWAQGQRPVQSPSIRALARNEAPHQSVPSFLGWVEDELIVVLKRQEARRVFARSGPSGEPIVNDASLQGVLRANAVERFDRQFPNAQFRDEGSPFPDMSGHYKVKLGAGQDLDAAVAAFEAAATVDHVEKIGVHSLYQQTPNDPFFTGTVPSFPYNQWHLWDVHSIDADLAWDDQTGDPSVLVGILDSGTRYFHVDLGGNVPTWGPNNPSSAGNVFINPGETAGNGVDDDGNGFVDDTVGWDFVSNAGGGGVQCRDQDCNGVDNDPDDGDGHGTHTAGTVGMITNNAIIGAGVAGGFSDGTTSGTGNGCRIVPLRIGYHARYQGVETGIVRMDWAAEAMNYLSDLVDAGHNVASINCSWGSSNSGGLGAAVDNLQAHDVLIVHAAGNSNSSSSDYLGSKAGVVSVAATDINGNGASFTNHGSWVEVAAPGVDIVSTFRDINDPDPANHYLGLLSGTSMAAPHVAGIAALLESCNPSLSAADKAALIINNTDPYSDARNLGSGIANARLALNAATCGVACNVSADFSADTTSGCASLLVNFTDLSTGAGVDGWDWSFGDGGSSSAQNPSYSYASAGTYAVSLTASSSSQACSDGETKLAYVTVGDVPVANFSGSPTSGNAPLSVNFTDLSSGSPTAWSWTFGDGGSSNSQDPSHGYGSPGTYTVTLNVSNACGADGETKVGYITVNEVVGATDMWVSDILVVRVNDGQGFKHGQATVTIVDNNGAAVSGATVTGDFSGKTNESGLSGVTNGSGQVTFNSASVKGGGEWCFEVTNVTGSLTYVPGNNLVTQSCESGDVF